MNPKTDTLQIRVSPDTKQKFMEAAKHYEMQASELLRELVVGLIEGRVTITLPTHKESLYNVNRPGA